MTPGSPPCSPVTVPGEVRSRPSCSEGVRPGWPQAAHSGHPPALRHSGARPFRPCPVHSQLARSPGTAFFPPPRSRPFPGPLSAPPSPRPILPVRALRSARPVRPCPEFPCAPPGRASPRPPSPPRPARQQLCLFRVSSELPLSRPLVRPAFSPSHPPSPRPAFCPPGPPLSGVPLRPAGPSFPPAALAAPSGPTAAPPFPRLPEIPPSPVPEMAPAPTVAAFRRDGRGRHAGSRGHCPLAGGAGGRRPPAGVRGSAPAALRVCLPGGAA